MDTKSLVMNKLTSILVLQGAISFGFTRFFCLQRISKFISFADKWVDWFIQYQMELDSCTLFFSEIFDFLRKRLHSLLLKFICFFFILYLVIIFVLNQHNFAHKFFRLTKMSVYILKFDSNVKFQV